MRFLLACLTRLAADLEACGQRLVIRRGGPAEVLHPKELMLRNHV